MPMKESKADFDKLISQYGPEIRALVKKTRALVFDVLPDANEKTIFGWSNTWYGASEKTMDAVFTISPMKAYVQLFFLRGTELADPDELLEGTGKKLRHVKIRDAAELKRPALRRLMKRAVAHGKKSKKHVLSGAKDEKSEDKSKKANRQG
jgi:hypothetical protein